MSWSGQNFTQGSFDPQTNPHQNFPGQNQRDGSGYNNNGVPWEYRYNSHALRGRGRPKVAFSLRGGRGNSNYRGQKSSRGYAPGKGGRGGYMNNGDFFEDDSLRSGDDAARSSSCSVSPEPNSGRERIGKENSHISSSDLRKSVYGKKYSSDRRSSERSGYYSKDSKRSSSERERTGSYRDRESYRSRDRRSVDTDSDYSESERRNEKYYSKDHKKYREMHDDHTRSRKYRDERSSYDRERGQSCRDRRKEYDSSLKRSMDYRENPGNNSKKSKYDEEHMKKVRDYKRTQHQKMRDKKQTLSERFTHISPASDSTVDTLLKECDKKSDEYITDKGKTDKEGMSEKDTIPDTPLSPQNTENEEVPNIIETTDSDNPNDMSFEMNVIDEAELSGSRPSEEDCKSNTEDDMELSETCDSEIIVSNSEVETKVEDKSETTDQIDSTAEEDNIQLLVVKVESKHKHRHKSEPDQTVRTPKRKRHSSACGKLGDSDNDATENNVCYVTNVSDCLSDKQLSDLSLNSNDISLNIPNVTSVSRFMDSDDSPSEGVIESDENNGDTTEVELDLETNVDNASNFDTAEENGAVNSAHASENNNESNTESIVTTATSSDQSPKEGDSSVPNEEITTITVEEKYSIENDNNSDSDKPTGIQRNDNQCEEKPGQKHNPSEGTDYHVGNPCDKKSVQKENKTTIPPNEDSECEGKNTNTNAVPTSSKDDHESEGKNTSANVVSTSSRHVESSSNKVVCSKKEVKREHKDKVVKVRKEKHAVKRTLSSLEDDNGNAKRARHKTSEGTDFASKKLKHKKESGSVSSVVCDKTLDEAQKETVPETHKESVTPVSALLTINTSLESEYDDALPLMESPSVRKAKRQAKRESKMKERMLSLEAENSPEKTPPPTEKASPIFHRSDSVKSNSASNEKKKVISSSDKAKAPKSNFRPHPVNLFEPDLPVPKPATVLKNKMENEKKKEEEERLKLVKEKVKQKSTFVKTTKEVKVLKTTKGKTKLIEGASLKKTSTKHVHEKSSKSSKPSKHGDISRAVKSAENSNARKIVDDSKPNKTGDNSKPSKTMDYSAKDKLEESETSSGKNSEQTSVGKLTTAENEKSKKDSDTSKHKKKVDQKETNTSKTKDRNIFDICNFSPDLISPPKSRRQSGSSKTHESCEKVRQKSGERKERSNSLQEAKINQTEKEAKPGSRGRSRSITDKEMTHVEDSQSVSASGKEAEKDSASGKEAEKESSVTKDRISHETTDDYSNASTDGPSGETGLVNQLVSSMGERVSIFGQHGCSVFESSKKADDSAGNEGVQSEECRKGAEDKGEGKMDTTSDVEQNSADDILGELCLILSLSYRILYLTIVFDIF